MTETTRPINRGRGGDLRGLGRYMKIIRLFDEDRPDWTIADLARALAAPASTTYRAVQDMVAADFLEPTDDAHYRLGACFIEIDRVIRITDPFYAMGAPLLQDVWDQARVECTAILARLYNDTIMCVADYTGRDGPQIRTRHQRGLPRPLTRGATSKVILAQLPKRRLERLLAGGAEASDADALLEELKRVRKQGFCVARGEVDPERIGIAAPVSAPNRSLVASVSLILHRPEVDPASERRLTLLVQSVANVLTQQLNS